MQIGLKTLPHPLVPVVSGQLIGLGQGSVDRWYSLARVLLELPSHGAREDLLPLEIGS